ncbi:MAG: hypothetical protein COA79_04435 [Planctomycetota bacterium]|nr:MAG: hypothetical protein COA79_04435 [Planctomycetota bacterium]
MELKQFKDLLKHHGTDLSCWPNDSEAIEFLKGNIKAQEELEAEKLIDLSMKKMQSIEAPSDLARDIINSVLTQKSNQELLEYGSISEKIEKILLSKLGIMLFVICLSIVCWFSIQHGIKVSEEEQAPVFANFLFNGLEGDPYGN